MVSRISGINPAWLQIGFHKWKSEVRVWQEANYTMENAIEIFA